MKLVKAHVVKVNQEPSLAGVYRIIDYIAGVTVNRNSIHDDCRKFVDSLIKKDHMAPLEFGAIYLKVNTKELSKLKLNYNKNPYSRVRTIKEGGEKFLCITSNLRVLVENKALSDLDFWSGKTEDHKEFFIFKLDLSRGIADEFARHKTLSPLLKSTRYVDESGKPIEFVQPYWYEETNWFRKWCFRISLRFAELGYKIQSKLGAKPQEAREVLPLALHVTMFLGGFYIRGTNFAWSRFFKLRCDKAAHPDARALAEQMKIQLDAELDKN